MAADPELAGLPATMPPAGLAGPGLAHGGSLEAAARRYPGAPRPFLDLSTGINPVPYPLPALPPEAFARLPEPGEVAALEAAAATAYGCADPAMVVAAPGTQVLIGLLPWLFPARDVTVLAPTYAEHARAWAAAGSVVRAVPGLAAARGAACIVACNPNNPDGHRLAPADLLAASTNAGTACLLIVDEAFADLEPPGLSLVSALSHSHLEGSGVIVLRSFGKTYGLAGLRLGFLLAAPALAARVRDALGPWAVSGPALAAGLAALPDTAWRDRTAARLAADADRLDRLLAAHGMASVGGTRLFRLATGDRATALLDRLGRAGVLARAFAHDPDLIRFGIPGRPEDWRRLEAALARTD